MIDELPPIEPDPKVNELRDAMERARQGVDPAISTYVQAALEFGVEQTRSEYRGLAKRNWREIARLGRRLLGMFALILVAVTGTGVTVLVNVHTIQRSREERVRENCEHGRAFMKKLRAEIASAPEPAHAQGLAQLKPTEELIVTLTGPILHCDRAVLRVR